MPTRPTHSAVVVPYTSFTCLLVGTTTMKFGVARYGPVAPSTSQFGKYDAFTITGTPVRDTSNSMLSSVEWMFETVTGGSAFFGVLRAFSCVACCQLLRAVRGQRAVERGGVVEPRDRGALPRARARRPSCRPGAAGLPSHFQLGSSCMPVDHDRLVRERRDERGVRDLVDRPTARRLVVEIGDRRDLRELGVRGGLLLHDVAGHREVADAERLEVAHTEVEVLPSVRYGSPRTAFDGCDMSVAAAMK